jgi:hypothetical protein
MFVKHMSKISYPNAQIYKATLAHIYGKTLNTWKKTWSIIHGIKLHNKGLYFTYPMFKLQFMWG